MNAAEFARTIGAWTGAESGNISSRLTLAIRHAIGSGRLRPGERLPPERDLARALSVSRPTVSAVMHQLREVGLVSSRQGSGTWVTDRVTPPPAPIPFAERLLHPGLIDLAAATAPDASLLPSVRVESSDLLSSEPANGLNAVGLPKLRDLIATRLRRTSSWVERENVVVTSGAHQALALLVAALVPPGSAVLVEEVTYGGLVDIIEANGLRAVAVARDADGPVPEALRHVIEQHDPAMIVFVASVHSPTGSVSSVERRAELAQILASSRARVVIDETYADLEFVPSGRSLASLLGRRAILVGSLSKTAWLGLRTGWIAADPDDCQTIVRRRWSQFDLGPAVPSQLFAHEILGQLDALLGRRRTALVEKSTWLTTALESAFPDWEITPVEGGLGLWARLPEADSAPFVAAAAELGVALMPGALCRADRAPDPHIRICFDRPGDVLEEALDRMAGARVDVGS